MRRERRIAVAVLGIVAIVAVVWWLRGRGDGDDTDSEADGSGRSARIDPRTGKPIIDVHAVGDRRIAGVVMLDGAPVAGAGVFIGTRAMQRKVSTDAAGKFDFGMVRVDRYTVFADKAKLMPASRALDLRNPVTESDHLVLVLHACDASIHGTVRDAGGPIAKAHVGISGFGNGAPLGGVDSDDQGAYELCLPADGAAVTVDADGYARAVEGITASGRLRRDFLLIPEAVLVGRAIRDGDKSPVPGALVDLIGADYTQGKSVRSTLADDEGRFRIDGLRPGRYSVTATTDGMATAEALDVVVEVGKEEPVVCTLVAAVTISGKVVDPEHRGVGGLTVTANDRSAMGRVTWLDAISTPDGSFAIEHVLPGNYMVGLPAAFAKRDDKGPQKITVGKSDVRDIVIETGTLSSIAGRVTYDGKPADGVQIRTDAAFSTTDHEGKFELRGLTAGAHEIYAESKRLGAFTRVPPVTLAANEQRTGLEIVLDLAGSVEGVVVDQNDKPVSGAFLSFSLLSGKDFGQATTDEAGRFRAGAMSGGGEYLYEVRIGGASGAVLPPLEGRRHPPIAVADGRSHITGTRVRVRYERLVIAGKVLSSRGEPVPDAQVQAVSGGRKSWDRSFTTTDGTGTFTIGDLASGNYNLFVSSPRATAELPDVAAGRRDVVIKLADPGSIEGTLVGFASPPTVVAYGGDRAPMRATVTGNSFVIRDVPVGRYRLMANRGDDPPASAVVEVKTGEIARATLTGNADVGTVTGVVVDAKSREPLANISCSVDGYGMYAKSDAAGAIRFERFPATAHGVSCYGPSGFGAAPVTVAANQTVKIEIAIERRQPKAGFGHAGLTLETKLGEVIIDTIEAGGPAARAGIQAGDTLLQVDGVDVEDWYTVRSIEAKGPGVTVKLKIEHADKERVVELKLDPDKQSVDKRLMDDD